MIICAYRRICKCEIAHRAGGVVVQRCASQAVGTMDGIPVHCNNTAEALSCTP